METVSSSAYLNNYNTYNNSFWINEAYSFAKHIKHLLSVHTDWIMWGTAVRRGIRAPTKSAEQSPEAPFRGTAAQCSGLSMWGTPRNGTEEGLGQRLWDPIWLQKCWGPNMNLPPFNRLQKSKFHGILCFSRKSTRMLRERSSRSPGSAHSLIQLLNLSGRH